MGFLAQLFGKGEEPDKSRSDEVLGRMEWSDDDEVWFGEYKGTKFSVAYDRLKQPSVEVLTYAREILDDPGWLASTLAEAKKRASQECGDFYSLEIDSLSFDRIHFYLRKGKRRLIADLHGGKDDKLWRIEYEDRRCEGIGFDR